MATGATREYVYDEDGNVVDSIPVPRETIARAPGEATMREHFTLSGAYDAANPLLIVAGRSIQIPVPGAFSKFAVAIRTAHIAYIGIGRSIVSDQPGAYDDLHPGAARLEDRVQPTATMSIMFPEVPADDVGNPVPVEVIVYAGEAARPV